MNEPADAFQVFAEALSLLRRARGASSKRRAQTMVRSALRAVQAEAREIGVVEVRALANEVVDAWGRYERVRDGEFRKAASHLGVVMSSFDSLRAAARVGGVETVTLVIRGCDDEELLRCEIPADRIPKQYRGKGGLELIGHDGRTTIKKSRAKTWVLRFPELHAGQMEIYRDPSGRIVLAIARQWGKTLLLLCIALAGALRGADWWWAAPSFRIGDDAWVDALRLVRAIGDRLPGVKVELRPTFRVTFPSGGTLQFVSSDDPASLRSATKDGLVLDEAAFMSEDVWHVVAPVLAKRGGRAMFASTPNGMNWFHDVFEAAERDGWSRYHHTTEEGGLVPLEAIEEARATFPPDKFQREWEAVFTSASAQLFHPQHLQHYRTAVEDGETVYVLGDESVPLRKCRVFSTADLAVSTKTSADYSVVATWAATPKGHLLLIDAIRDRLEADGVIAALRLAHVKHGGTIFVEKATQTLAIISMAKRERLPISDIKAERDKLSRAQGAAHLMATGRIWFPRPQAAPWVTDLLDELFSFPSGRHDDFVDCLAYASLQASERKPRVYGYQGPSEKGGRVGVRG